MLKYIIRSSSRALDISSDVYVDVVAIFANGRLYGPCLVVVQNEKFHNLDEKSGGEMDVYFCVTAGQVSTVGWKYFKRSGIQFETSLKWLFVQRFLLRMVAEHNGNLQIVVYICIVVVMVMVMVTVFLLLQSCGMALCVDGARRYGHFGKCLIGCARALRIALFSSLFFFLFFFLFFLVLYVDILDSVHIKC